MRTSRGTRKRVVRHRQGFGILLTRDELQRLGLHEDDEVEVVIRPYQREIDWDALPLMERPGPAPEPAPTRPTVPRVTVAPGAHPERRSGRPPPPPRSATTDVSMAEA